MRSDDAVRRVPPARLAGLLYLVIIAGAALQFHIRTILFPYFLVPPFVALVATKLWLAVAGVDAGRWRARAVEARPA